MREGLGVPVAPGRAAAGEGLESVVVVEDAVGLDEFFEEEEGEGEEEKEKGQRGPDMVPGGEVGGRDTMRGRVELRRGRQRAGITADEDIEDEEGKKWY